MTRPFRAAAGLGLALPCALLVASYAAIAAYSGSPWLWSVVVHESGDRTLRDTILYYEHAARELPLDVLLGAAIAAGVLFAVPPRAHGRSSWRAALWAGGLAAAVAVILAGTLSIGGVPMLYENLLQFPTRPGSPPVWGGHWRYHLLSHVALMLSAFGLAGPLLLAGGFTKGHHAGARVFGATLAVFLAFTIAFVPQADSFAEPTFLGHQARELFTHALVTVPLGWGVCLLLARGSSAPAPPRSASLWLPFGAAAAAAAVAIYLLVASLRTAAASQGQSDSLAVLIFPHFFEHAFSYVVSVLTAGLVFQLARRH